MANILEFVRAVLIDPEAQQLLEIDAEAYVTEAGFDDLTGEDVVEAVLVLRRSLPPEVAGALGDFEDEEKLPRVRPSHDERELDAAIRQLRHSVTLVSGEPATNGAKPEPKPESAAVEAEPESEPAAGQSEPEAEPEDEAVHDEPIEIEAEPELTQTEPQPVPQQPAAAVGTIDVAGLPSVDALRQAIAVAAADAQSLLNNYADDVRGSLSEVLTLAERDAAEIRASAEREAAAVRAAAESETAAMRVDAERDAGLLRADADTDRETARQVLLDARGEAERIVAEVEQGRADLESRRTELREAEREMKERIAGLDSVFRSVLKDD